MMEPPACVVGRHSFGSYHRQLGAEMALVPFRPKPPPKRPPAASLAKQISLRQTYKLTAEETECFYAMARSTWKREGFMFKFWQDVAAARGLDYRTMIGNEVHPGKPVTFSALPCNHGKGCHWCWPEPLIVAKPTPPKYLEERPHG